MIALRSRTGPLEQVDELVDLFPGECEDYFAALPKTPDPTAQVQRYRTTELPPIKPHTTEYRLHAVRE